MPKEDTQHLPITVGKLVVQALHRGLPENMLPDPVLSSLMSQIGNGNDTLSNQTQPSSIQIKCTTRTIQL